MCNIIQRSFVDKILQKIRQIIGQEINVNILKNFQNISVINIQFQFQTEV